MEEKIRLQKVLAQCGIASRRKAEELINQGSVKVNGKTAQLGDKVDPKKDKITVKGKRVSVAAKNKYYYIMLHKPRGFITTMSDEKGRHCVAELVKDVPARVFPVGRLDRESEGLLLLTNDGDFANKVTHPSEHVAKVYRVTVRPDISKEQVQQMCDGIEIDGRKTKPCDVHVIKRDEGRAVIEVVLREGRNRQIRKMCAALGLEVARLKRTMIGQVKLGMLPQGKWRELTKDEVKRLTAQPNTTVVTENYK
ncbi:MAG: rRNA pseudouridine synthase [Clostridia bacterium]|nr:rRNA pseudouridine synthase [Clostridia bacterium]